MRLQSNGPTALTNRPENIPMANPEHIEILRLGAETWNSWRSGNPNVNPDFQFADLHDLDLGAHTPSSHPVNLRNADFRCTANLEGINLDMHT